MDQLFRDFSVDKQNILLMTNALFLKLKLTSLSLLTFLAFSSTGYTSQSVEVQIGAAKDNTLYESTTQLQRTATYNMSAMNRRDEIVRSLGDQER